MVIDRMTKEMWYDDFITRLALSPKFSMCRLESRNYD